MRTSTLLAVFILWVTCTASDAADTSELKAYSPEGARCAFSTIRGRKPVTGTYDRGTEAKKATVHVFCFDQSHCRCQVRFIDLPDKNRERSPRDLLTEYGPDIWTNPGKLEREESVKSEAHEGKEFLSTWTNSQDNTIHARVRVFLVEDRAYFVSASYTASRQPKAEPEAQAFLDSFRILAK